MSNTSTNPIKPTVGRIVYYKSAGSADGTYPSVERAAIVTNVHSDTCVDLCVFNPTGLHFNQRVEYGDDPMQWHWMPYQMEQAAKKEIEVGGTPKACVTLSPLEVGDEVFYVDPTGQRFEATATQVWTQECINLTYTAPCGTATNPTSIPLKRPGMTGNYFDRKVRLVASPA